MTRLLSVTPILRIFDEAKAREFYLDFLGFAVEFEHRFGENFPIYLGIVRDDVVLHLSEHHGDATPGARVRIGMTGLADYCEGLRAKEYRYAKPGAPERQDWGFLEMTLGDPFGNHLTFCEEAGG
jgi:uncharacterized glyoxalase superfamily protein PhnB